LTSWIFEVETVTSGMLSHSHRGKLWDQICDLRPGWRWRCKCYRFFNGSESETENGFLPS